MGGGVGCKGVPVGGARHMPAPPTPLARVDAGELSAHAVGVCPLDAPTP
jgi:hypothetical protein